MKRDGAALRATGLPARLRRITLWRRRRRPGFIRRHSPSPEPTPASWWD